MKLQTSILPRRDGTVLITGEDGEKYVFKADADGAMVCDVPDDTTVSKLLAIGDFEPYNAEDFDKAIELAQKSIPVGGTDADDGLDDGDDGDDGNDGDEVVNGGLPVEAKTPPATVHKAGVKGVPAKKAPAKTAGKSKAK